MPNFDNDFCSLLIQETKQPQGDLLPHARLQIVQGQKTVW